MIISLIPITNMFPKNWYYKEKFDDDDDADDDGVVVNWQLSKQHIRRLVKCDHIARSCVDPSIWPVFWSYPLTSY